MSDRNIRRKPQSGDADPRQFLAEMVEPTLNEFFEGPLQIRRGILAVFMVTHLVDHLYYGPEGYRLGCSNLPAFKQKLELDCPELMLVRELSNRTKHLEVHKILYLEAVTPRLLLDGGGGALLTEAGLSIPAGPRRILFSYDDETRPNVTGTHNLVDVLRAAVEFLTRHVESLP